MLSVCFVDGSLDIQLYIVLEKCERSLDDAIYDKHEEIDWRQKLQYLLDIAQGVQCMHGQDIYHRLVS